jgi:tRNA U34 5-methylaminomethyl-2-thiouridine-forming methyltransferase MnmC
MLELVETADGSNTLFNSEIGEHYHSRNGALQESTHVFLNSGLCYFLSGRQIKNVNILEVGFGTGLNFLITANFCTKKKIKLDYTGIEAFPIKTELLGKTGYNKYVPASIWNAFYEGYSKSIRQGINLNPYCHLRIAACTLLHFKTDQKFDVLYFDAFAVGYQPEMWTEESLTHICRFLKPGGVFVTYAITGNLKRTMKSLGFSVEKAAGARGKREMLRAIKLM